MRALIQRVSRAEVGIDGNIHSSIGAGLLILLGVEDRDTEQDADWLAAKIRQMRIFNDEEGKMNRSAEDIKGEFLVVSQFTLHAQTAKGNRPSFIKAARPEKAVPLYEYFMEQLRNSSGLTLKSGVFGADMQVALVNDGPVTIWMDSQDRE